MSCQLSCCVALKRCRVLSSDVNYYTSLCLPPAFISVHRNPFCSRTHPYSVSRHDLMTDFSLSFWLLARQRRRGHSGFIRLQNLPRILHLRVSLESGCNVFYLPCSNSLCAPSPSHLPTELISGNSTDFCLIVSHT